MPAHAVPEEDDEDPFLVTSHLEILSLMRVIERRRIYTHLSAPQFPQSIVTTLLHVDADRRALLFGHATRNEDQRRLMDTETITLDMMLDSIRIYFDTTRPALSEHEGEPALQVPLPRTLHRIQRRENHRVAVPPDDGVRCVLPLRGRQGTLRTVLPVVDLSAGGVSLLDDGVLAALPAASRIDACSLVLPRTELPGLSLEVRHMRPTQTGTPPRYQIGCRFVELPNQALLRLQQYLMHAERAQIARARQLDPD